MPPFGLECPTNRMPHISDVYMKQARESMRHRSQSNAQICNHWMQSVQTTPCDLVYDVDCDGTEVLNHYTLVSRLSK